MNIDILSALTVLTSVFTLLGYIFYNKNISCGTCRPNITSWILWTITYTLNLVSYFLMTGDPFKVSLQFVSVFACIATLFLIISRGTLTRLNTTEKATLAIGFASGLAWWWFHSATIANMVLQFGMIAAFAPTYLGVWKDPSTEGLLPWISWSFAYITLLITVILRWQGTETELVFPILGLILNLGITLIIQFRPQYI